MSVYRLAPHVHVCRAGNHVVVLDLRRDKYLAIGEPQMHALASVVEGWPSDVPSESLAISSDTIRVVVERMVLKGLLTADRGAGKSAAPACLPPAVATLIGDEVTADVRVGARRVRDFLASAAAAAASLHWRSFESVVRAVATRKARYDVGSAPLSLDALRDAVMAYERLRPLVFTSRDACLFDSLALANCLARERMFPTWVVGVKTGPFAAHSWLQAGDVVLNDLHDRVRKFTPILVV